MQLSPPKNVTFYVGAILWLLGLAAPYLEFMNSLPKEGLGNGYVLSILGGLVLILGNLLKGL